VRRLGLDQGTDLQRRGVVAAGRRVELNGDLRAGDGDDPADHSVGYAVPATVHATPSRLSFSTLGGAESINNNKWLEGMLPPY
jgi:hypothetical protein